jgi:ABC-type transport system involved in multi-copper enzyme maturation permease subunit
MRLSQLGGIVRYEILLQWRQRMVVVVMLSAIALPVIMYVLFGQSNADEIQRTWITAGGISTEAALKVTTRYATLYSSMSLYMITLLILPIVSADVIAKDRQHGVREVLDSLPLTTGTYLAGKVLSWGMSVLIGLVIAMSITGAALWLLIGPYHVTAFAAAWLAIGWGIGVVTSTLTLLLAAGQPTRRRAIGVAVIFAALCLFANVALLTETGLWTNLLNPGRSALSLHFLLLMSDDRPILPVATPQHVIGSLLGGLLEVAVVWAVVWAWLRRKA